MLGKKPQPLAEQIGETVGYVNEIFDRKIERIKISAAEKSATAISGVAMGVILGILALIMSVFGLATLAFWIAGRPELVMGFGIITSALILLLVLIFFLRKILIVNPAVKAVIGIFFNEQDQQTEDHTA